MSFHQKTIYVPPDSVNTWEFILTATRGAKTSAPSIRQVVVGEKHDVLALVLDNLVGDTLVYTAQKDAIYQSYTVVALTVQGVDDVVASHQGQTCALSPQTASLGMKGLSYSGDWVVKRKITPAEAADHHLIPGSLLLMASITTK